MTFNCSWSVMTSQQTSSTNVLKL